MTISMTIKSVALGLFIPTLAAASAILGYWICRYPERAIQRQIDFYRLINWRMEPIDLKREIQNTRGMGLISLLCGAAALTITIFRCR